MYILTLLITRLDLPLLRGVWAKRQSSFSLLLGKLRYLENGFFWKVRDSFGLLIFLRVEAAGDAEFRLRGTTELTLGRSGRLKAAEHCLAQKDFFRVSFSGLETAKSRQRNTGSRSSSWRRLWNQHAWCKLSARQPKHRSESRRTKRRRFEHTISVGGRKRFVYADRYLLRRLLWCYLHTDTA